MVPSARTIQGRAGLRRRGGYSYIQRQSTAERPSFAPSAVHKIIIFVFPEVREQSRGRQRT